MLDKLAAEILENWNNVNSRVADAARAAGRNVSDVNIVAVSKTHSVETVAAAYRAGIRVFGENYAQELRAKATEIGNNDESLENIPETEAKPLTQTLVRVSDLALSSPIIWHFIGHLQTNKCKYVAPFCRVIHSVDSVGLARELSKFAVRTGRGFAALLQINTSGEASKYGCSPADLTTLAESIIPLKGICIKGLMTIAGLDGTDARREFAMLRDLRGNLSRIIGTPESALELSMGMSGDFPEAIAEGATIVRIGSLIFGERSKRRIG